MVEEPQRHRFSRHTKQGVLGPGPQERVVQEGAMGRVQRRLANWDLGNSEDNSHWTVEARGRREARGVSASSQAKAGGAHGAD